MAEVDTLAFIKIRNAFLLNDSTFEFSLRMQRNSQRWYKFANGTYQFVFPDSKLEITQENLAVEMVETDLNIESQTGLFLPEKGYYVEPKIFPGRISITVLGPPGYDDCLLVPHDSSILVGRFLVHTLQGELMPTKIGWKQPYNRYQASAFKLLTDSMIVNGKKIYNYDDNVTMDDQQNITYELENEQILPPSFNFNDFWVSYRGNLVDSLFFRSNSEYRVRGYTILRGVHIGNTDVEYKDTVFTYLQGEKFNPAMVSKGNSFSGFSYGPLFDSVKYRGGEYCYQLRATYFDSLNNLVDTMLAERCTNVPNAVIEYATASPNPFNLFTTIKYTVSDDVYITIRVFDLSGKEVKLLTSEDEGSKGLVLENVLVKRGTHTAIFRAPELASQGVYDILLYAKPVNDNSVEMSRAIVKVQLVKDGSR